MLWNRLNSRSAVDSFRNEDEQLARNVGRLVGTAYRVGNAPEALRTRVAALALAPVPHRTFSVWKPACAGAAVLTIIGGLSFLPRRSGEPADAVLAQTKAAMAGVTEFHSVILGLNGKKQGEIWYSRELGFRSEGLSSDATGSKMGHRSWWIDDQHRTRFWDEAKKTVTVDSSDMARPGAAARITAIHTGEGVLEQLTHENDRAAAEQERSGGRPLIGTVELDASTVDREGKTYRRLRSVRRMPFTKGPETWIDVFWIDPRTDRIVETESHSEPSGKYVRIKIDYPRSLPRELFRFQKPVGSRLVENVPSKVSSDPDVEECIRNVRGLAIQLGRRSNKGPLTRRQLFDQMRTLRWCPSDNRKGENDSANYTLSEQRGLVVECRRHKQSVIRGHNDGRVTLEKN